MFVVGNSSLSDVIDYRVDMILEYTENVSSFDVYVNGDFYGTDVNKILMNTNDTITVEVVKTDTNKDSVIKFENKVV